MKKHVSILLGLMLIFSSLFVSCEENELDSNICRITIKSDGYGTVSITNYIGTSVNVLIGNSVEVVATPDEGYAFIGWYVSGNDSPISTDTAFTFITSEDVTLTARFIKLSDIIIRSGGNGSVSFKDTTGNSRPVLPGTEVTVVATPDKDCDFVGWFVGDSDTPISTESVYTFTVTENIVLTGQFIKRPVITICSAGDGNVSFKDFNGTSVAVRPDTEVTVIATPYKNCDFIGWFIDEPDTLVSTDIEYSFVVTEDIVLIAKFYNGEYINETFASDFGAFITQETVGNHPWIIDYSTAKATSYVDTDGDGKADTNKEATSWLVSPTIDLTNETEAYIAFEYIIRYAESGKVAANHQLLISADYTGDPATATWTDLPYGAVEGADWVTFYKANVAVPAEFLGKSGITFALRYTATTKAGTWEVKNFVVAHGAATGETPEEPETPETPDTPVVPSGENMLANGSFEDWSGNVPTGWGGPVGSNATISQNTDANTGNYSVLVAGATGNKRLTSKSYFLAPGTYTLAASFKQSDANAGMFRLGYLKLTNGAIANTQTDYKYITEPAAVTAEWTQTAAEFTLTETTEVAIIIMNSKNGNGASFLVDDVILTTTDGGITEGGEEEGGEEPETPSADKYDFTAVTSVTAGAQYLIVAGTNQATALDASKSYGYLPVTTVNPSNGVINTTDDNVFVIEAVDGGYSIKDALGRYLYMKGDYNSVNLDTTLPAEGGVWTIEFNADGTAKITNTYNSKFMQFDSQYNSYGIYPDARGTMPTLYKKN